MRRIETKNEESEELTSMSILGHLEELRSRLLKCLAGIAIAIALSFTFTDALWDFVEQRSRCGAKGAAYRRRLWLAPAVC